MNKREEKIVMFRPFITDRQYKAILEKWKALHDGSDRWIGQGPAVTEWEKVFESKSLQGEGGTKKGIAVAVNSGTAALETAYELAKIKPGDKVITTALTCTATNIPLVRMGAKLLWADIRQDTLNISEDSIRELLRLHPDTKAIINVHLSGIESKIEKYTGIYVIDDCAQALGIFRDEADYSCYSFQGIKHVTTGDGGMLVTRSLFDSQKAKRLRWFGIDREKKQANDWQAYKSREMTFDIEELGYKRQPTDLDAVVGIAGLDSLDEIMERRKQIFDVYRSINVDGFKLIDGPNNKMWTAGCLVERRDDFAKKLRDYNIETNIVEVRNDLYTVFGGKRQDLPNMNFVEDRYIFIPLHNWMTIEDAEYVKGVIEDGW